MKLFTEIGRYLLMLKGMFSKPENMKMYWKELMHQCSEIGFGSLGIVAIISVFIGAVSTIQTAYQLVTPLIPLSTIAQIVRDTVASGILPLAKKCPHVSVPLRRYPSSRELKQNGGCPLRSFAVPVPRAQLDRAVL